MMPTTLTLANGRQLQIRPITTADGPRLLDLFAHLGPDSRYRRFHQPVANPSPAQVETALRQLTTLIPGRDAAFLVESDLPGEPAAPIAVARYNGCGNHCAEMALVVRDELQGQGIGRALTHPLVEHARAAGIRHLVANVQPNNTPMLRILNTLPYPKHRDAGPGTLVITFDLDPAGGQ